MTDTTILGPCFCGHPEDELQYLVDCGDFLACEAMYLYSICRSCCVENEEYPEQAAWCADRHDHRRDDEHHCPTAAALDARDDPSATTTIPIDVAREHAWLANYALEMLVDTGDGTYHPIADALAKVRDLLDPSATTEGGAS